MDNAFAYIGWMALVVVLIGVGWALVMFVRRWAHTEVEAETFTIQDLREMHARGDISEQEFAAMRSALLAQLAADCTDEPADGEAPSSDDSQ